MKHADLALAHAPPPRRPTATGAVSVTVAGTASAPPPPPPCTQSPAVVAAATPASHCRVPEQTPPAVHLLPPYPPPMLTSAPESESELAAASAARTAAAAAAAPTAGWPSTPRSPPGVPHAPPPPLAQPPAKSVAQSRRASGAKPTVNYLSGYDSLLAICSSRVDPRLLDWHVPRVRLPDWHPPVRPQRCWPHQACPHTYLVGLCSRSAPHWLAREPPASIHTGVGGVRISPRWTQPLADVHSGGRDCASASRRAWVAEVASGWAWPPRAAGRGRSCRCRPGAIGEAGSFGWVPRAPP